MRIGFRVDASEQIGIGHVMRCLALANAAAKCGAEIRFVARAMLDAAARAIEDAGHHLVRLAGDAPAAGRSPHASWLGASERADAEQTKRALDDAGGGWDWIVVDHYAIGAEWEAQLRSVGRILAIDDLADRRHECDALLDQNLYVDMESRYDALLPMGAERMLGPRFALLRPEFTDGHHRASARAGRVARVLVAFGGSDPADNTSRAVDALRRAVIIDADVVIGASHPRRAAIEAACGESGYRCHVQTQRMAELMLQADLAVGAGGISTWERCAVGLPTLAFAVAKNQDRQVRDAALEGIVCAPDVAGHSVDSATIERHLRALLENDALRQGMSQRGLKLVDGDGVARVSRRLGWSEIVLRSAAASDGARLLAWRNHPSIRAVSSTSDAIDPDEHRHWLDSVLSARDRMLLIGERGGVTVGVVRFDLAAEAAEVSIYLVPADQGGAGRPGEGSLLLRLAEQRLRAARPDIRTFRARVLGDNRPSHGLFTACGYSVEQTWYSKRLMA